jgi:hypothetical protein
LAASSFLLLSRSFAWRISRRGDDKAVGDHASFMRIDDAIATSQEGRRKPQSGRANQHRRWGREQR